MKLFYKIFFSCSLIALLIILFVFLTHNTVQTGLEKALSQELKTYSDKFQFFKNKETLTLSSSLELFSKEPYFKNFFLNRNREALYNAAYPQFLNYQFHNNITHFSFILPDGTCFLRVHNKDYFGDKIERTSLKNAIKSKSTSSSIELGKTAFALRVVKPYYYDGKIIGYVEFAEEIDHFLKMLKSTSSNHFTFFEKKQHINKKMWEIQLIKNKERNNWDDFNEYVLISTTSPSLKNNIQISNKEHLESFLSGLQKNKRLKMNNDSYVLGLTSFKDSNNNESGLLLSMLENTELISFETNNMGAQLKIFGIILFFVSIILSYFISSTISKRVENMTKHVHAIGQGDFNKRVSIESNDEIGHLASEINFMADQLQDLYFKLELKVSNKTNELSIALLKSEEHNKELHNTKIAVLNMLEDIDEGTKELENKRKVLEIQKKELEKANLELDSFVYTASHDLRAPLRGICSFSNFLKDDYSDHLDDKGIHYIERIINASKKMTRLIDDLLALSKIGRQHNPFETVDINVVLKDILERIEFDISESRVVLLTDPCFPKIICDEIKIAEVFLNLINNAIKFSSKNEDKVPKIEISYLELSTEHQFSVKDNGIGIDPKYHDQIFGIFKRLHDSSEYDGTGAGLSIVKRIIDDHYGRIWIESDLGKGSTFHFTIPKNIKRINEVLLDNT